MKKKTKIHVKGYTDAVPFDYDVPDDVIAKRFVCEWGRILLGALIAVCAVWGIFCCVMAGTVSPHCAWGLGGAAILVIFFTAFCSDLDPQEVVLKDILTSKGYYIYLQGLLTHFRDMQEFRINTYDKVAGEYMLEKGKGNVSYRLEQKIDSFLRDIEEVKESIGRIDWLMRHIEAWRQGNKSQKKWEMAVLLETRRYYIDIQEKVE